ncbi:MAG: HTH domain-containing protein [Phaeodactylibacter sp.]|nr:HTH domain-containing protein [Phaeodactylibacter sp.]
MTLLEQIALLKRMDALIRRKSTGTPCQLAEQLDISRSSVFNYIKVLKQLGAPVVYSHECRSYIYAERYCLEL